MEKSKDEILCEILGMRRRVNVSKGEGVRDIEIFEDQLSKSLKRIEQTKYLAKKFNTEELLQIYKAYESLRNNL